MVQIDWKEYFSILFLDVENVTLDFETELIQISNIEYFEALFELISTYKNQASKYECSNNNQFLYIGI